MFGYWFPALPEKLKMIKPIVSMSWLPQDCRNLSDVCVFVMSTKTIIYADKVVY